MKRETRYLVFKLTDLEAFTSDEVGYLKYLLDRHDQVRRYRKAKPLNCIVVESDWPEYEPVWKMIEQRVDNVCKTDSDYKGTCSEGTPRCYVDHDRYSNPIG